MEGENGQAGKKREDDFSGGIESCYNKDKIEKVIRGES